MADSWLVASPTVRTARYDRAQMEKLVWHCRIGKVTKNAFTLLMEQADQTRYRLFQNGFNYADLNLRKPLR